MIVDDNQFNLMPLRYMIQKLSIELSTIVNNISTIEMKSQLEYKCHHSLYNSQKAYKKHELPLSSLKSIRLDEEKDTK